MKWKPWVFKTVSIPSDVRCLHLKQNALQKGNLFGRVETITPYIEGFHSSIDAKLIKSDITDVLVFVWRQTCTHLDRSSLVVVSVTINLNTKIKTDWTINLREGKLVFIKTKKPDSEHFSSEADKWQIYFEHEFNSISMRLGITLFLQRQKKNINSDFFIFVIIQSFNQYCQEIENKSYTRYEIQKLLFYVSNGWRQTVRSSTFAICHDHHVLESKIPLIRLWHEERTLEN